ncbi:MAG: protein translocase subunit SecF [Clostridium sp.]
MLKIIEKSKLWLAISLTIIIIGLGFMFTRGLNFGIDFKGGSKVVIELGEGFNKEEVDVIVKNYAPDAVTNISDGTMYEIKSKDLPTEKVAELFKELKEKYSLEETAPISEELIGASIGQELTRNAILALSVACVAMLIYIAIRFEMNYGIAAFIALVHDVLITVSVFAIFNIPVNTPFIAAILTVVGYSMSDTIVIFDRIRENSKTMRRDSDTVIANVSLTQTLGRSINTTLTTLFCIVAINVLVPSVREFSFPLIIGIAFGAYSSMCVASPVWVILKKRAKKKKVVKAA